MEGRIDPRTHDLVGYIEDVALSRRLQVSILQLFAREQELLELAQQLRVRPGPGACDLSVFSSTELADDEHYLRVQLVQPARSYTINRAQRTLDIRIRGFRNLFAGAVWSHQVGRKCGQESVTSKPRLRRWVASQGNNGGTAQEVLNLEHTRGEQAVKEEIGEHLDYLLACELLRVAKPRVQRT